jgi:uncharacterized OB-fold protein
MSETPSPILPDVEDPAAAPFWAGAREGRLLVQTCGACGTARFPPRLVCGACGQAQAAWREANGRGRIWSFVVVHGPTLPALADLVPFPVAVVELEDYPGVRMVGNLAAEPGGAINSLDPADIAIDQPVTVSFRTVTAEVALPVWSPAP